jgi:hypothetical protein
MNLEIIKLCDTPIHLIFSSRDALASYSSPQSIIQGCNVKRILSLNSLFCLKEILGITKLIHEGPKMFLVFTLHVSHKNIQSNNFLFSLMARKIIHLAFLVLEMDVVENDTSETFAMMHLTLLLGRFSLGDSTRDV